MTDEQSTKKKHLAILIFDDAEVLDFAGPFEVFSVTNELAGYTLLDISVLGLTREPVRAKNGLTLVPDHDLESCPPPDYLIIPGGSGTRPLLKNQAFLDWLKGIALECDHILSVCSGSLVLAKAGLLTGLDATTHHEVLPELEVLAPDTRIHRDKRFTDNGKILTSAGVAAGMDMSLYMVEKLFGEKTARATAQYIEYHPQVPV